MDKQTRLRQLPKTDEVLARPEIAELVAANPRAIVLDAVRDATDAVRTRILGSDDSVYDTDTFLADVRTRVTVASKRSLHGVINATGIIVHTNLGRSLLSERAVAAVAEVAGGYSTLEYDVVSGERGSRHVHCEEMLCRLTGAEAAIAVNNNASAVMMAISALSRGKEAIVSRGQLVEIGGSFRVPDIMAESGATMVEVGTTNKTHLCDYENAITERTGLLLKVHSSNFRVIGFTQEIGVAELVELGDRTGVPIYEDQGSGVLVDLRRWGLPYEPTVGESIAAGAHLVSCSGDKLLGGPQAGLLLGRKDIIDRLKKHPLARVLRLDKMTLAALEVTLRTYLDEDRALAEIPTLRMLSTPVAQIRARAEAMADRLRGACGDVADIGVADDVGRAGGGALPMADIPSAVVSVSPRCISEFEFEKRLRLGEPTIVARIKEGRLLFDLRTLQSAEENAVIDRIAAILGGGA
ncbi:MAG: L-seryl-tRNA(Sec) selenium transferase [Actinomycetota bacterium]|nr:L-seryl-tRNA(Sec) selenium transferase [Actinomycetota bacterium]